MKNADRIRSHVVERYIDPARSRGEETITVVAGAVLREMELRGDYAPSVCSALRARKFCTENDLVLIREVGPKSKQSTATAFTYRLPTSSTAGRAGRSAIWDLLGVGEATFAALGGGERWLTRERAAFVRSAADRKPIGRQGSAK